MPELLTGFIVGIRSGVLCSLEAECLGLTCELNVLQRHPFDDIRCLKYDVDLDSDCGGGGG